jgi:hypothetical protein
VSGIKVLLRVLHRERCDGDKGMVGAVGASATALGQDQRVPVLRYSAKTYWLRSSCQRGRGRNLSNESMAKVENAQRCIVQPQPSRCEGENCPGGHCANDEGQERLHSALLVVSEKLWATSIILVLPVLH